MEYLLSGFFGALFATIISVVYLNVSQQSQLRSEVALEVVAYFDQIYISLQNIHVDKDAAYTGKKRGLTNEEYRISSRKLRELLNSSKAGVKLCIIYGEGDIVASYNYLSALLLKASQLLWAGEESNWNEKNPEIHTLFRERIDPARNDFENKLIKGTRPLFIMKGVLGKWFSFLRKPFRTAKPDKSRHESHP